MEKYDFHTCDIRAGDAIIIRIRFRALSTPSPRARRSMPISINVLPATPLCANTESNKCLLLSVRHRCFHSMSLMCLCASVCIVSICVRVRVCDCEYVHSDTVRKYRDESGGFLTVCVRIVSIACALIHAKCADNKYERDRLLFKFSLIVYYVHIIPY